MTGEASFTDGDDYDFLLVGAGSAACLIASRLSQRLPKHRILLLEAGLHIRDDPKVQIPGLSSSLQSDPAYDWQYLSAPEPGLNQRRVQHPRGKLAGGTSAINSHSIVFPNYEWQDRLADKLLAHSAKADWGSQGMKESYKRWQAGSSDAKADDHVGTTDFVQTSYPRTMDVLQLHWLKVFEELGHVTGATGFTESRVEAVTVANAVDSSKGERSHAATAFLEPALKRGNVTLKTGVKVESIVFDETSIAEGHLNARSVRFIQDGKEVLIRAREVVLCAGTFESPALLERSGIGAKNVLSAANVPLLYELPGVGENLQDHLNCSMSAEVRDDVPTRDEAFQNPEEFKAVTKEYEQSRRGRLSEGPAYSFAFTPLQMLETESETQELTDMVTKSTQSEKDLGRQAQFDILQRTVDSPHEATATTFMLRSQRHRDAAYYPKGTPSFVDGKYVTAVAMLSHPFSRGSCHITADPSQHPAIQFNYLSHPLDVEILARHLRLIERLFQRPAFSTILKPDGRRLPRSFPRPISSVDDAKEILAINSATNYHPCGTCSMMREDLGGVVDEQLRVYGIKNVRVCDASVLPIIPRGNILTAVYAYAEKAADILCREVESRTFSS